MAFDLVIFDLDGTLIAHRDPIWKTLHGHFGSDPVRRRALVQQGLAGVISYAEWFAGDLALLTAAGATRQAIVALLQTWRPTRGAQQLVSRLRSAGIAVAVVSGGLDLAIDVVLPDCAFDAVFINRIAFHADGRIASGRHTPYDLAGKAHALDVLAARFDTTPERVAFVGDGNNDHDIMRAAGYGIAWGDDAPPTLVALADHHERSGDLMSLWSRLGPANPADAP